MFERECLQGGTDEICLKLFVGTFELIFDGSIVDVLPIDDVEDSCEVGIAMHFEQFDKSHFEDTRIKFEVVLAVAGF
jgi:hypothetical protein